MFPHSLWLLVHLASCWVEDLVVAGGNLPVNRGNQGSLENLGNHLCRQGEIDMT
ncbi:hypothetical protein YSY22_12440 [Brevibacillus formosus]